MIFGNVFRLDGFPNLYFRAWGLLYEFPHFLDSRCNSYSVCIFVQYPIFTGIDIHSPIIKQYWFNCISPFSFIDFQPKWIFLFAHNITPL